MYLTESLLTAIEHALNAALAGEGFDGGDFDGENPDHYERALQWVREQRDRRAQSRPAVPMTHPQRAALALISDGRVHTFGHDLSWAGRSLRALSRQGFVTVHDEGDGANERYSITDAGREVVDGWKRAAAQSQG